MGIGKGTIINSGACISTEEDLDGMGNTELVGPFNAVHKFDYKGTDIGNKCIIGNNVVIRPNVHIGDNVVIAHQTIIEPDTWIGDNTTVQVFAAFASHSIIGNNCFIGPYFSTTNAFEQPHGPKGTHPKKVKGKLETLHIGNDVVIGSNCSTAPGIVIGDNVDIGMNCWIKADIPSGESPDKPRRIRAGTVWTKKDLAYVLEQERKDIINKYINIVRDN